jgi:hypothetical protein
MFDAKRILGEKEAVFLSNLLSQSQSDPSNSSTAASKGGAHLLDEKECASIATILSLAQPTPKPETEDQSSKINRISKILEAEGLNDSQRNRIITALVTEKLISVDEVTGTSSCAHPEVKPQKSTVDYEVKKGDTVLARSNNEPVIGKVTSIRDDGTVTIKSDEDGKSHVVNRSEIQKIEIDSSVIDQLLSGVDLDKILSDF